MIENLEKNQNEITEKPVENKNEIAYYRPKFWKRVFAAIFDFLIFFFLTTTLFVGFKEFANQFTPIKKENDTINRLRLESDIFVKYENRIIDIVTFNNGSTDKSFSAKEVDLRKRLNNFFTFVKENSSDKVYEASFKEYEEYLLSSDFNYEGKPYFTRNLDGKVTKNWNAHIPSKNYVEIVYNPYIDKHAQGILVTKIPEYLEAQKKISYVLLFAEVPLALVVSGLIIYYAIPLIFSRGKQTLGKLLFKIGLVNKNVLSVSAKQYTLRFLIFIFLEVLLSLVTLGIPIIISFSMMAFSKKKQSFHDYMLGIEEVDVENSKIYKSYDEIYLKPAEVEFKDFNSI